MVDQTEWWPVLQTMYVEIEQALCELQKIWKDIGCSEEMRMLYYKQAQDHMIELLKDMMTESHKKRQSLSESIENLLKQTTTLYAELHLDKIPNNYENIPLCKIEQLLQTDLENLEHLKRERMLILNELLMKEHEICEKLGSKKLNINPNILPSEQELESFKLCLQKHENEKIRLEEVFKDIRRSIIKTMNDLDIAPSSSFEQLIINNPEEFVLSANNMAKLREFRDKLKTQVEETKCHVERMKEDLLALWKYLDEPADIYQSFLDKYSDYSTGTVSALEMEIKRCKEKRKENIFKYVTQVRHELMNLWDLCRFCEAERNTFAPFHSNTFTEDLLTLHEIEVERLHKFYNDNQKIFELVEQRENILTKIKELLQRANNPDRYHNRGGQLLMEEKERKIIQKKLPKIEKELEQLKDEYETKHNRIFTIYGISLEDVLAETWENINHEKETMKKARKEAKDKSIKKSPLNCSKRTPAMSHLSIHRIPTPAHLSKRKLFSMSPNTSKKRNKISDKNKPPTITVSKVRRSGRLAKMVQKTHRSSKGGQKNEPLLTNSIVDTTYNKFQGHMTGREELHSSMIPEQILKSSNKLNIKKTPIVRTPMKPIRKNLSAATTPINRSSARKTPHSPRIINTPKLVTAPSNLPIIF